MGKIGTTVRVDKSAAGDYDKVVAELEKAGLSNVSTTPRFLTVHGEIEEDRHSELERIAGVASVRRSQSFKGS